jgi:hypothetical protein
LFNFFTLIFLLALLMLVVEPKTIIFWIIII